MLKWKSAKAVAAEEWRTVLGFPDYEVSSLGRVRSRCYPPKVRILKLSSSGKGPTKYWYVSLSRDGKSRTRVVHQLVLEAFDGPSLDAVTRHLDGNGLNNCVTNLAWGTPKQNSADRRKHGRGNDGERNPMAKLRSVQASEIRKRVFKRGDITQLAKELDVCPVTIGRIRRGKTWR